MKRLNRKDLKTRIAFSSTIAFNTDEKLNELRDLGFRKSEILDKAIEMFYKDLKENGVFLVRKRG
ncbi:ribbon-helix-helix domain-containing protein [Bacillus badius]|uniref:ribbon-helix-helix domain-containing protein n=1 Tax=Bacillus badius TaxID=1455 RepID=UPI0007B3E1F7|nr:ribbon-helix-helix domain-containing protein [Bacillus badius]KZR59342.1 hypothetical protein A3781_13150 [Bacillus badius]